MRDKSDARFALAGGLFLASFYFLLRGVLSWEIYEPIVDGIAAVSQIINYVETHNWLGFFRFQHGESKPAVLAMLLALDLYTAEADLFYKGFAVGILVVGCLYLLKILSQDRFPKPAVFFGIVVCLVAFIPWLDVGEFFAYGTWPWIVVCGFALTAASATGLAISSSRGRLLNLAVAFLAVSGAVWTFTPGLVLIAVWALFSVLMLRSYFEKAAVLLVVAGNLAVFSVRYSVDRSGTRSILDVLVNLGDYLNYFAKMVFFDAFGSGVTGSFVAIIIGAYVAFSVLRTLWHFGGDIGKQRCSIAMLLAFNFLVLLVITYGRTYQSLWGLTEPAERYGPAVMSFWGFCLIDAALYILPLVNAWQRAPRSPLLQSATVCLVVVLFSSTYVPIVGLLTQRPPESLLKMMRWYGAVNLDAAITGGSRFYWSQRGLDDHWETSQMALNRIAYFETLRRRLIEENKNIDREISSIDESFVPGPNFSWNAHLAMGSTATALHVNMKVECVKKVCEGAAWPVCLRKRDGRYQSVGAGPGALPEPYAWPSNFQYVSAICAYDPAVEDYRVGFIENGSYKTLVHIRNRSEISNDVLFKFNDYSFVDTSIVGRVVRKLSFTEWPTGPAVHIPANDLTPPLSYQIRQAPYRLGLYRGAKMKISIVARAGADSPQPRQLTLQYRLGEFASQPHTFTLNRLFGQYDFEVELPLNIEVPGPDLLQFSQPENSRGDIEIGLIAVKAVANSAKLDKLLASFFGPEGDSPNSQLVLTASASHDRFAVNTQVFADAGVQISRPTGTIDGEAFTYLSASLIKPGMILNASERNTQGFVFDLTPAEFKKIRGKKLQVDIVARSSRENPSSRFGVIFESTKAWHRNLQTFALTPDWKTESFTVDMSDLAGQSGYFRLFPNVVGDGTGMNLAIVRIREFR